MLAFRRLDILALHELIHGFAFHLESLCAFLLGDGIDGCSLLDSRVERRVRCLLLGGEHLSLLLQIFLQFKNKVVVVHNRL